MTTGGKALRVLSTGAPKGGISGCAKAWQERTGRVVAVEFVTAPVLRERVEAGTAQAEVIVAPVARMNEFQDAGRVVAGSRATVGSVKAGVVIRDGAALPDISTVDTLRAAILAAQSIVYNVATSGQYIVRMMDKLGVSAAIRERVTTVPNGAAVMTHLAQSRIEKEIGFGQLTEIRVHEDRGLPIKLVGPLPNGVENVTTYCAAVFVEAEDARAARAFVEFIGGEEGRELCRASGLEF